MINIKDYNSYEKPQQTHSQVNLKTYELEKKFGDNKSRDKARRDHNQSMKVIGNQYAKGLNNREKEQNVDDYESAYLPQLSQSKTNKVLRPLKNIKLDLQKKNVVRESLERYGKSSAKVVSMEKGKNGSQVLYLNKE